MCGTFKKAACRRGSLEGDQESYNCLTAAAISEVPAQLRQLFVTILLFNLSSDPLALWNKHKVSLSEDYLFKARILAPNLESNECLTNKALSDIQYRLEQQGKSLSDFPGMPVPSLAKSPYDQSSIIRYEMEYDVTKQLTIAEESTRRLNPDQNDIFECIMEVINDPMIKQRAFYIDGPGGTGKTFLYNTILAKVRAQNKFALTMASSGIAALLLQGGRTVHSRLKVPIPLHELSVCNISKQSALAKLIQSAKLLVWDEAPMIHRHAAECIDRSLRDLCSCDLPLVERSLYLEVTFVKFYH